MERFVGRAAELDYLKQAYEREGSGLLVVYGSRGVGKTRLLREFCKDKKHSYYLGRACSEREQRGQWAAELNEALHHEGVGKYPEWEELFSAAVNSAGGRTHGAEGRTQEGGEQAHDAGVRTYDGEKRVLVIDEFHFLVKGSDAFFQELVRFLDGRLLSRSVLAVLVTSASGWVENSMVKKLREGASSISNFLKLRELSFAAVRELFPEFSERDALGCFAVLGGVPGYWKNLSGELGIRENMIKNILSKESRLYSEIIVFLEQELREPAVYNTILAAMARGCGKLNDIYRHTGFLRAKISVYLKNLMELNLVEKFYSYETDGQKNAQKGVYRILNPYMRFYFRYLFPNQSALELLTAEDFYREKIESSFPLFVEEAYRQICRERIGREYRAAGEWLGKAGSLDVVASDGQGGFCVAACFYSKEVTAEDYEWLRFSMKKAKIKCDDVRIYGEQGFDDAVVKAAKAGKVRLMQIMDKEGR